ncbi:CoA-binding protein [Rhodoferax sp.]|uniref:CoA-binding protein n=1 Tax=Rhodoferax sp. TaxID=50421 RepID=UPI001ECAEDEF|nr:CoA-binding protein [Rhodoferax sp.]MBT9505235.1 CoA-binding protein [Rhodoferax sp.]
MFESESENIRHILRTCRTVAVVGLSPKPHRASFEVSQYMQAHGWRIIPVNPVVAASGKPILGERVYATLTEAARHEKIDLVNVFRNAQDVPPVAAEAIAIGAPALWLQLGIEHEAAVAAARAAGLCVVQNKCLKVEYAVSA